MSDLKKKVQEDEQKKERENTTNNTDKKTSEVIRSTSHANKKQFSIYIDNERYEKLRKINEKRGISNNSMINLLISDYVIAYEHLLDKE